MLKINKSEEDKTKELIDEHFTFFKPGIYVLNPSMKKVNFFFNLTLFLSRRVRILSLLFIIRNPFSSKVGSSQILFTEVRKHSFSVLTFYVFKWYRRDIGIKVYLMVEGVRREIFGEVSGSVSLLEVSQILSTVYIKSTE